MGSFCRPNRHSGLDGLESNLSILKYRTGIATCLHLLPSNFYNNSKIGVHIADGIAGGPHANTTNDFEYDTS